MPVENQNPPTARPKDTLETAESLAPLTPDRPDDQPKQATNMAPNREHDAIPAENPTEAICENLPRAVEDNPVFDR